MSSLNCLHTLVKDDVEERERERTFKGFVKVMNGKREMREEEKQWLRLKFKYRD